RLPSPVGLPFRLRTVERVGFEPTVSGSRNRRIGQLSYLSKEHPAGIEPARPAWRAGRLPLHHGCTVGPEGLEPSPPWLRARYAAANTWIPCQVPTKKAGLLVAPGLGKHLRRYRRHKRNGCTAGVPGWAELRDWRDRLHF